ncbi:ComF family protein [Neobacillus vireti]|uniref:ComF family protein n=1 Tax=Neobacillus vireti TaxID=220686 RepID=UPI0030009FB7
MTNTHCLICHDIIQPLIGWISIFSKEKELLICSICEGKLEKVEGETCRICSRPFQFLDERFKHDDLCHDCKRWEEDIDWNGYLTFNHSIFTYNEFLKEIIATYKFRGDYVLSRIFAPYLINYVNKINPDLLVPIPLSEERLYERGFNQAEALIIESGLISSRLLTRTHAEKQSKKSRSERIHIPQVFKLDQEMDVKGKSILLIDDIYTTGSTLRHAAKLIKGSGAQRVHSFTLAR